MRAERFLYTDGACRGNPGLGGAGAVLTDQDGRTLASSKKFIGHCTNNIAEYRALILGLNMALDQKIAELSIRLDSELLVRQIEGTYRVKNPSLQPLMTEIRSLLDRFDDWQVRHVPRSENAIADQLANEAIDEEIKIEG